MKELLEDLKRDLAEINAPKKAHIAIEQIIQHYLKRADEIDKPEQE